MSRVALVLVVVALMLLALTLMRSGWLSRARRQAHIEAPMSIPAALMAGIDTSALPGRYLGTTNEGDWLGRIVVHRLGVPSSLSLQVSAEGLSIDRPGSSSFLIPANAVDDAHLDNAACGKAYGPGGVVVVSWRLGGQCLDTAVRLDDPRRSSRVGGNTQQFLQANEGVS